MRGRRRRRFPGLGITESGGEEGAALGEGGRGREEGSVGPLGAGLGGLILQPRVELLQHVHLQHIKSLSQGGEKYAVMMQL